MNDKQKLRFDVLDGLRGIAIVLVFLNHVDSHPIIQAFPVLLRPLVGFWFTSGTLAVSFFFILSGFLMGYLYPNPPPTTFIRKRYARIFPPFLVMVVAMSVFRQFPTLVLPYRLLVIFALAGLARIIWVNLIEKYYLGPRLIRLFFVLQVGVFIWYGLVIMRHTASWFALLPQSIREVSIALINGTLMLPLGDYVPMLDGVYWSLIGEVLFYVLYPYLFAPAFHKIQSQKNSIIIALSATLIPFFFGISTLFTYFRGYQMIKIEYFFYFSIGIMGAIMARHTPPRLPTKYKALLNPFTFFLLVFAAHEITFQSAHANQLLKLMWAIPFGLLVYFLLDPQTPLHKTMSTRFFIFLGTISYSLYIVHTAVVDGMHVWIRPHSPLITLCFVVATFGIALGTAYLLHRIIEEPYFTFKEPKPTEAPPSHTKICIAVFGLVLFIGITFFTKYMGGYNFFSMSVPYSTHNVTPVLSDDTFELSGDPLILTFTAHENNLGIITAHITHTGIAIPKRYSNRTQFLLIRIRQKGQQEWYAEQQTSTVQIGTSSSFPFGFPVIADSKGKQYELALEIANHTSHVTLSSRPTVLNAVYQLDKKNVLSNPLDLLSLLRSKIQAVITNKEAQLVLCTIVPFLILYTFFAI